MEARGKQASELPPTSLEPDSNGRTDPAGKRHPAKLGERSHGPGNKSLRLWVLVLRWQQTHYRKVPQEEACWLLPTVPPRLRREGKCRRRLQTPYPSARSWQGRREAPQGLGSLSSRCPIHTGKHMEKPKKLGCCRKCKGPAIPSGDTEPMNKGTQGVQHPGC